MKKALLVLLGVLLTAPFSVHAQVIASQLDLSTRTSLVANGVAYIPALPSATGVKWMWMYFDTGAHTTPAKIHIQLTCYVDAAHTTPCPSAENVYFKDAYVNNPTSPQPTLFERDASAGTDVLSSTRTYVMEFSNPFTTAYYGQASTTPYFEITDQYGGSQTSHVVASSTAAYDWSSASSTCANGNTFAEGLCLAGAILFIPNREVLEQYQNLNALAQTKIPFYYVSYIQGVFSGIATSSSSNLPLFSIPLSRYASSTVTGTIPDISISTTTISTYLPDWSRLALQALLTAAIWLAVGWHVFHTAMNAPPK